MKDLRDADIHAIGKAASGETDATRPNPLSLGHGLRPAPPPAGDRAARAGAGADTSHAPESGRTEAEGRARPDGATDPATGTQARADPAGRETPTARSDGALGVTIEGRANEPALRKQPGVPQRNDGGSGGGGGRPRFHRRGGPQDYDAALKRGMRAVWRNMLMVFVLTIATNLLILSIPIYLFQISSRVLTSRSVETLIMLTVVIGGAVVLQAIFDAIRRFILMRTAVEVAAHMGGPVLSAAAAASLNGNGREYQTLGDLQQLRSFLTSGTLLSFLDVPFVPLFTLMIFYVHPHLGMIVVITALALFVIAIVNQRLTSRHFGEATLAQAKANQHLDSMARNSQIINAMAMIPEAVSIWGKDTATSLTAQVRAQDRNIISASISRGVRLLTQVALLGWGAYLAIHGQLTGGMVIAASIIAGRALAPVEGAIEGWNAFLLARGAYDRITRLLRGSRLQFERLRLPEPKGRLDVERLLYVPTGTKHVVLNNINFSLSPGESLAVIGNSGAGKTTLGKMLVGSILPTSGSVRLDLMDLRNWDPRQLGENIGYLPQDVQLFPGTIKQNIARMRRDADDEAIYKAATLADVHEMIASLPHGYETMVAADGSPLSGGQKQRIGLARAFFGDPRLLVLDEPNSNLDMAGDRALANAIDHARKQGMTVVVITQKPALLNHVDKIMLLANGTISLFGTREKVLERLRQASEKPKTISGNEK